MKGSGFRVQGLGLRVGFVVGGAVRLRESSNYHPHPACKMQMGLLKVAARDAAQKR